MSLHTFIERTPWMLSMLKKLVETESPSHDKIAVDAVSRVVADECRRLGAKVDIIPSPKAGDMVMARFDAHLPQGDDRQKPAILLLHHMDTVFPLGTLAKMPFYTKDDKTYGPGVLDMKGGVVVSLAAIDELQKTGKMPGCPVIALFTSDEEIGSENSRDIIEAYARQSMLVLVLESGMLDGAVKVWRKGVGDYTVTVKGRAAHAGGAHQEGRNAIEEMAHQVLAIQKLTDYEKGTTLNVGVIHGGFAANVVPDECVAEIDFRVLDPAEAGRVDAALRALKPVLEGTTIEVTGGLNRPPMPFDTVMQTTLERARQIAASIGMELKWVGTGGASDANFVAPLGIPVLDGLGPCGEGYHSEREYILTASLAERAELVAALLSQW